MVNLVKHWTKQLPKHLNEKVAKKGTIASLLVSAALASTQASAFNVQVATAPDNSLPLILQAIGNAKQSLLVNIYELASPEVAQALIDQINRGLHVQILQEGEPVGGISAASRGLHAQIAQAMEAHPGCCSYGEMHKGVGGTRRFRYDHAKYIVIDQGTLLLGSENYSPGGQPEPGTLGNRGWEVLVYDAQPARWFAQIFAKDSDPRQPDIVNLLRSGRAAMAAEPMVSATQRIPGRVNPMMTASDGEIITSPDTSLSGLVGLIRGAKKTLDIEQMSFNVNWGTSASPLYTEIVAAAQRGVHIRILLNDEYAFMSGGNHNGTDGTDGTGDEQPVTWAPAASSGKTTTNRKAVAAFTQLAQSQHLPIDARIANLRAMGVAYIHNKGMIVDGKITLISSINWTQNSITNNREAALALTSPQIAAYYGQAFNQDWTRSPAGHGFNSYLYGEALGDIEALNTTSPVDSPIIVPATCPNGMNISAKIGTIRAYDNLDPSYLALQQQTLSGSFKRDTRDQRCILFGPGNLAIEFRLDRDGTLDADLEGYTTSMKPFSIRADFAPGTQIAESGKVFTGQGYVLEGSYTGGGRKRRLGPAELTLQAQ